MFLGYTTTLHIKMNYWINKIKCSIGKMFLGYTTTLHINNAYMISIETYINDDFIIKNVIVCKYVK
jgi:hypothetical protein